MLWMIRLADAVPEDDDVVAGPWGAVMFVLLLVAVALLCLSFLKQIRKTRANAEAGVFGDPPARAEDPASEAADPADRSAEPPSR